MNDLVLGFSLLATIAGALFLLGARLGRTLPVRLVKALGLVAIVALGACIAWLNDDVLLAKFLPFSNLVVVGNGIPPLLGFLGGLAWSLIPRQAIGTWPDPTTPGGLEASDADVARGPRVTTAGAMGSHALRAPSRGTLVRRWVLVLSLQAVGWVTVIRPIWGSPPRCRDRWEGDFCIQTTDSTCTAACAATLLRAHGIGATEGEMAGLCLTRRGTRWQGLYRGLKLKTTGTPWEVEVLAGPFDRLRSPGEGPAILEVGIARDATAAPIYTERYGWTPGEWHSVLFFGFRDDGRVAMGDPSPGIGKEEWTVDDLRVLWGNRGMRLVRRDPGRPERGTGMRPPARASASVAGQRRRTSAKVDPVPLGITEARR